MEYWRVREEREENVKGDGSEGSGREEDKKSKIESGVVKQ